tara:strand:- start:8339 stop:9034 length:696 start_codon:yes stop_codon:yes gene_type:complete
MSWPSNTKAATTYVDSDTDEISRARRDIKKNFDNVNDIIDEFNIASPQNNNTLEYNTSESRFNLGTSFTQGEHKAIISLDTTLGVHDDVQDSSGEHYEQYAGGFSIDYTNSLGITVGTSGGRSKITFPAGSYIVRHIEHEEGNGTQYLIETYWTDNGSNTTTAFQDDVTVYWSGAMAKISGVNTSAKRLYQMADVVTFSSSTDVFLQHRLDVSGGSGNTFSHPPLHIERIA